MDKSKSVDLGDPGPQCGVCAWYDRQRSILVGHHNCLAYPAIAPGAIDGSVACQVGPVVGRRLDGSKVGGVVSAPAKPAVPDAPEAPAAIEEPVAEAPKKRGRPKKNAGK